MLEYQILLLNWIVFTTPNKIPLTIITINDNLSMLLHWNLKQIWQIIFYLKHELPNLFVDQKHKDLASPTPQLTTSTKKKKTNPKLRSFPKVTMSLHQRESILPHLTPSLQISLEVKSAYLKINKSLHKALWSVRHLHFHLVRKEVLNKIRFLTPSPPSCFSLQMKYQEN